MIIKLDAYPYKEYGTLTTTLDKISALPKVDKESNLIYELEARMPGDMKTSYGNTIPFKPESASYGGDNHRR